MFCPNCGRADIAKYENNLPVADFSCLTGHEDYELKSKKGRFGPRIVDGAYGAMMRRLAASDNPNLICMNYDLNRRSVTDLFVLPKQFFMPDLIEERPPLGPHARRAGWVGCNIRLDRVPESGKVFVVRERQLLAKADVLDQWRSTLFLRDKGVEARGWLIEVMRCVDAIGRAAFSLDDVYAYEDRLTELYPNNQNVRPKIRQQLQVLRDQGYIDFSGKGRYRLSRSPD